MSRFDAWQWEEPRRPFHPVTWLAIIVGMGLVVSGMWAWGAAGSWAWDHGAARPEVMAMAIRSAAVAVIALGQWFWIGPAGTRICRRDVLGLWLGRLAGIVAVAALITAAALAWIGR